MDNILIVDDDNDLRGIVKEVLKGENFNVTEAEDGLSAVRSFGNSIPDVVLLDMNMPGMDGSQTMLELKKLDSSVPVIVLTAYGDVPTAVGMIKQGAYDFTLKPPDFDRLLMTIRKAVETRQLNNEVRSLDRQIDASLENRFGRSSAMRNVIRQIKQIARTNVSVIIQGETGTGKTVAAEVIHNMSLRSGGPFVNVDIGLIPEQLVESELFGYKKGAFTGADRDRKGYFETSDKGTVFLDELENMSGHIQMKLLSVIERKVIYPLGMTKPINVDLRVIAATNSDIRTHVSEKRFREDLYYRLGEFVITIPPLRDRVEDILFFAEKFIREACADFNKQIRPLPPEAAELLLRHPWPGNLRELKNIMKRAVLLSDNDLIGRSQIEMLLGTEKPGPALPSGLSLRDAMRDLEFRMICEALHSTGYNRAKTAELLDTSYTNLLAKIKEYHIPVPERSEKSNNGQ